MALSCGVKQYITDDARPVQPGKVVILLTGRYAGKKAVIVKNNDDGTTGRPYGHAIVAGLAKEPRKVTSNLSLCLKCICRTSIPRHEASCFCQSPDMSFLSPGHQEVFHQEAGKEVKGQGEQSRAGISAPLQLTQALVIQQPEFCMAVHYELRLVEERIRALAEEEQA